MQTYYQVIVNEVMELHMFPVRRGMTTSPPPVPLGPGQPEPPLTDQFKHSQVTKSGVLFKKGTVVRLVETAAFKPQI